MASFDPATFGYLNPTDDQKHDMEVARGAVKEYAHVIDELMPDGPDKTYVIRKLREVAMWVNVAITRHSNGAPR